MRPDPKGASTVPGVPRPVPEPRGGRSDQPTAAAEHAASALRVCIVHYDQFALDPQVQRHAGTLAGLGNIVHVVGLDPPRWLPTGNGTIHLHCVRCPKIRHGVTAYLRAYARFVLAAMYRVAVLDRRLDFDVIEVHNMPDVLTVAALVPKLRGVPVVLHAEDTFPELFACRLGIGMSHPLMHLVKLEERLGASLADAVIAPTQAAAERLNDRGAGRGKTAVVMNSPSERVFGPSRPPVRLPRDGPLRTIYHGGLAPRFGVDCLVRAFGILRRTAPDVSLEIVGHSGSDSRLRALAGRMALEQVELAKPVSHEEIPAKLAAHHVGVVPNVRDSFTELLLPVKLLEYVHMGMPVVASRLSVIERYFTDEEVRFCEPGSPESLAEAILDVKLHPQDAMARARRAARTLQSFQWRRQGRGYTALICNLAASRRSSARLNR